MREEQSALRAAAAEQICALRAAGKKTPSLTMIKSEREIDGIREAGRVNSLVLDAVAAMIGEGVSTAEIDDVVVKTTRALGGTPTCLGFHGFPRSVCTSVNQVICHGIPSEKEILREGDIINVDCTTTYGGYVGDASRMFTIGKVDQQVARLVRVTQECLAQALIGLGPLSPLGDIGYKIASHAHENGYTVVREIGGHGVGLSMHEEPFVSHMCTRQGEGMLLLPGMVFTIEPMINEGSRFFTCDKQDGWTIRTRDGKRSAQVEHMLLITEGGYEILSR
jgi:methionyl aminopeptidase